MFIRDLLKQANLSFSFEFFPPKTEAGFGPLFQTISELQLLNPTFVSVTYGAGGSTRRKTIDLVSEIKSRLNQEAMAHLTCVGSTKSEIASTLDELQNSGIQNVIALRGDPPDGQSNFEPPEYGFSHANELVEFIKDNYRFSVGVAGYPETHQEATTFPEDLKNLKRKIDAGADFIITQLFFDNDAYFRFLEATASIGITVPIIPGIMPVISVSQIKKFTQMCGATIPHNMLQKLDSIRNDEQSVQQYGIEYAIDQCMKLLEAGAPGIHFYTLNRSRSTWDIFEALKGNGAVQ